MFLSLAALHRAGELQKLQGFPETGSTAFFPGRDRTQWIRQVQLHGRHLVRHGREDSVSQGQKVVRPHSRGVHQQTGCQQGLGLSRLCQ